MMHGREKSDSAIVAGKPTNKAVSTAAEPVERRAGAKGNASQQSTDRAQNRAPVSQALERVRRVARSASRRHPPKVGAVCLNWARTDLCGGREVTRVPTAIIPQTSQSDIHDPQATCREKFRERLRNIPTADRSAIAPENLTALPHFSISCRHATLLAELMRASCEH
jgi:hypothetical protein